MPSWLSCTYVKPKSEKRPMVVCCGDSLTHGHLSYDYVTSLRANDKSRVYINGGINGHTSWNLLQRIDKVIKL